MKIADAVYEIANLKLLLGVYKKLLVDPKKSLYNNSEVRRLIRKTNRRIDFLQELIYNYELEDSYDPNTGEYHGIYRE